MTDKDLMLLETYKIKFEDRIRQKGKDKLAENEKCRLYIEGFPASMQDTLKAQQYAEFDKLVEDSEIVASNPLVCKARKLLRSGRVTIKM
ncbi:hypothetical protein AXF42_Ash019449 [Apostasia shenzhenica]|uniref:Uncharacterized protein n=1 Tax=Apostasia shenzhenica TaxID=1088818 RepID=A0A2I0AYF2_9ASPA|nr:hypothetical protein AXF42_Ash019444 [Apostasia shenzhenica]PKA60556.1 hypothetical protein AXF42_Ash019449 [Apostasia shenzhenica]